ncbi:MAG: hypothetical protein WCK54_09905 [Desulfuromonadales bacterium]
MADTRVQLEVEDWVRREWMEICYSESFYRERLPLVSGGYFDFDAVNADKTIAATISTRGAKTASGKHAVGKLLKIRSDMYFLLLANVQRRIVVLTEPDMYELCQKESAGGRVHSSIEFVHAEIPDDLASRLKTARTKASEEVSPGL